MHIRGPYCTRGGCCSFLPAKSAAWPRLASAVSSRVRPAVRSLLTALRWTVLQRASPAALLSTSSRSWMTLFLGEFTLPWFLVSLACVF